MKFTKPILITTITLLSLLLGFVVVGQNTKPVIQKELQPAQVVPVTKIDTEKVRIADYLFMKSVKDDDIKLSNSGTVEAGYRGISVEDGYSLDNSFENDGAIPYILKSKGYTKVPSPFEEGVSFVVGTKTERVRFQIGQNDGPRDGMLGSDYQYLLLKKGEYTKLFSSLELPETILYYRVFWQDNNTLLIVGSKYDSGGLRVWTYNITNKSFAKIVSWSNWIESGSVRMSPKYDKVLIDLWPYNNADMVDGEEVKTLKFKQIVIDLVTKTISEEYEYYSRQKPKYRGWIIKEDIYKEIPSQKLGISISKILMAPSLDVCTYPDAPIYELPYPVGKKYYVSRSGPKRQKRDGSTCPLAKDANGVEYSPYPYLEDCGLSIGSSEQNLGDSDDCGHIHSDGGSPHIAIDFSENPYLQENQISNPGDNTIRAMAGGIVDFSGPAGGFGQLIAIGHGTQRTYYGHMSQRLVFLGDVVSTGQVIAIEGSEGSSTAEHIHVEQQKIQPNVSPNATPKLRSYMRFRNGVGDYYPQSPYIYINNGVSGVSNACSQAYTARGTTIATAISSTDVPMLETISNGTYWYGGVKLRSGYAKIKDCIGNDDNKFIKFIVAGRGKFTVKLSGGTVNLVKIMYSNGDTIVGDFVASGTKNFCKTTTSCEILYIKVPRVAITNPNEQFTLELLWDGLQNNCSPSGGISRPEEAQLEVRSPSSLVITGDTVVCFGGTTTLISGGSDNTMWFVEGSDGTALLVCTGKRYTFTVSERLQMMVCDPLNNDCTAKTIINVLVRSGLRLWSSGSPSASPVITAGQSVTLYNSTNSAVLWNDGTNSREKTVAPIVSTTYSATSANAGTGCNTASIRVNVSTGSSGGGGNISTTGSIIATRVSGFTTGQSVTAGQSVSGNFVISYANIATATTIFVSCGISTTTSGGGDWVFSQGYTIPITGSIVQTFTVPFSGVIPNFSSDGDVYINCYFYSVASVDVNQNDNSVSTRLSFGNPNRPKPNLYVVSGQVNQSYGYTLNNLSPGANVDVYTYVGNNGSSRIPENITASVSLYFHSSATFNSANALLISEQELQWYQLGVDRNSGVSFQYTRLPVGYINRTGIWYFTIVVDKNNIVNETNENDNVYTMSVNIVSLDPPLPDVRIVTNSIRIRDGGIERYWGGVTDTVRISSFRNTGNPVNDYLGIWYSIENIGNQSIQFSNNQNEKWAFQNYLSVDRIIDEIPADRSAGWNEFTCGAGQQTGVFGETSFRFSTVTGRGYIILDPNKYRRPEKNYNNNLVYIPIIVTPDGSTVSYDYKITMDSVGSASRPGDSLYIKYTVTNLGRVNPASVPFVHVDLSATADGTLDVNQANRYLYTNTQRTVTGSMTWGGRTSMVVEQKVVLLGSPSISGNAFVVAYVDLFHDHNDVNYSNNVSRLPILVQNANDCRSVVLFSEGINSNVRDTIPALGVSFHGGPWRLHGNIGCEYKFRVEPADSWVFGRKGQFPTQIDNTWYGSTITGVITNTRERDYLLPIVNENTSYAPRNIYMYRDSSRIPIYTMVQRGKPCTGVLPYRTPTVVLTTNDLPTGQYAYLKPQGTLFPTGVFSWYRDTVSGESSLYTTVAQGDSVRIRPDSSFVLYYRQTVNCGSSTWFGRCSVVCNRHVWRTTMPTVLYEPCDRPITLPTMVWKDRNSSDTLKPDRTVITNYSATKMVTYYRYNRFGADTLKFTLIVVKTDSILPIWLDRVRDTVISQRDTILTITSRATDSCGSVVVSYEDVMDTINSNTIIVNRTWIASDWYGNIINQLQRITRSCPDVIWKTTLQSVCGERLKMFFEKTTNDTTKITIVLPNGDSAVFSRTANIYFDSAGSHRVRIILSCGRSYYALVIVPNPCRVQTSEVIQEETKQWKTCTVINMLGQTIAVFGQEDQEYKVREICCGVFLFHYFDENGKLLHTKKTVKLVRE